MFDGSIFGMMGRDSSSFGWSPEELQGWVLTKAQADFQAYLEERRTVMKVHGMQQELRAKIDELWDLQSRGGAGAGAEERTDADAESASGAEAQGARKPPLASLAEDAEQVGIEELQRRDFALSNIIYGMTLAAGLLFGKNSSEHADVFVKEYVEQGSILSDPDAVEEDQKSYYITADVPKKPGEDAEDDEEVRQLIEMMEQDEAERQAEGQAGEQADGRTDERDADE